jgi:hypothetical protein
MLFTSKQINKPLWIILFFAEDSRLLRCDALVGLASPDVLKRRYPFFILKLSSETSPTSHPPKQRHILQKVYPQPIPRLHQNLKLETVHKMVHIKKKFEELHTRVSHSELSSLISGLNFGSTFIRLRPGRRVVRILLAATIYFFPITSTQALRPT